MGVLSVVAGGKILEKPIYTGTRCTESYDELRSRIYETLLPSQKEFVDDTDHKILGFCAGFGCLAGETLINGVPIRDLTKRPIQVETLAGPAWATPAYVKGYAALYRVRTQGGREFLATTDHRCLSPDGWVTVAHLRSGSLVAVGGTPHEQLPSGTATGCSGSGPSGTHSCGELPSPWAVFAQELTQRLAWPSTSPSPSPSHPQTVPSTEGSLRLSAPLSPSAPRGSAGRSASSLRGPQSGASALALLAPPAGSPAAPPPSAPGASRSPSLALSAAPDRTSPPTSRWFRSVSRASRPGTCTSTRPAGPQSGAASAPPASFPSEPVADPSIERVSSHYSWDVVEDVSYVRHDLYYDLHVPLWNHYLANGVVHHNSGKTYALCAKAIFLAMDNPHTVGAVFEPTAIMLRDVWLRSFDTFLADFEIEYDFRVSPQPEYTLHLPHGQVTLLCRATETYNRIRGQNLSFCLADEIDTSTQEVAQKASEMMLARLRGGKKPQLAVASTPEGFKFFYNTFVENGNNSDRHLIRARTTDNPHLPPGFVESLYANYDPQLIASYINGEFTNLANTTVYHPYCRDRHWCDTEIQPEDRLLIGLDLNVAACFTEVIVRRGDEFHVVAEHYPKDTPALVRLLHETYPDHIAAGNLVVIPDAASRQRTTTNASESDLSLLKKGGLQLKVQSANPQISDRVNCVNVLLLADRLKVHNRCKYLIKSLEQQTYDRTGKPTKGIGGLDDVSGPVDSLGYALSYLAPLRRWTVGSSKFRVY